MADIRSLLFALAATFALAGATPAHAASPLFRVDPFWPKPLPNNWILGQVGGLAVDDRDNIWVFQRPRSLTDDEKGATLDPPRSKCCVPAPSVLVFNQAGDVVKSWGGPGENLGYDWPLQEHGILVDNKGFVWLTGNGKGDNMVLKFTVDGKFLKEIGKSGPLTSSTDLTQFGQAAALDYDPQANEIYVADGYGNHRVAVFDAETGEIKRIWGAYGNPPSDMNLPTFNPKSANFGNPVHCVTLAKDGMVYVCDRTNDRVQVFTKQGKFVKEYAFAPETQGPGSTWGITFSTQDPDQKYAIMTDGTNNQIVVWRVADGQIVGRFGRGGHNAGQFSWVHYAKTDSDGNLYSGEVDVGKRMQKWNPVK